jgi:hypothetical protein
MVIACAHQEIPRSAPKTEHRNQKEKHDVLQVDEMIRTQPILVIVLIHL